MHVGYEGGGVVLLQYARKRHPMTRSYAIFLRWLGERPDLVESSDRPWAPAPTPPKNPTPKPRPPRPKGRRKKKK